MAKKTVSINEISHLAKVSPAAVSRALRGKGGVSERTYRRIRDIADELGYRPKHTSLKLKKTALIMPHRAHCEQSYYFREVYSGLVDGLYMAGISILSVPLIGNIKDGMLVGNLKTEEINTAVLLYQTDNHLAKTLTNQGVHCIALACSADDICETVIDYDNVCGTEMLLKHLAALGHKHIGLVYAEPDMRHHNERINCYRDFMKASGVKDLSHLEVQAQSGTTDSGRYAALQLLQQQPDCTAIFALNDRIALGVCSAIESSDRKIGDDIAVVGFDDIDFGQYAKVELTTVHVPYYDLALRAASIIVRYFETGQFPRKRIIEPAQLIIRESSLGRKYDKKENS